MQRILPSTMMPVRDASASISSRWWVVRTTEQCSATCWITSHIWRRAIGSMPALGSSKKTTRGAPISEIATESLRRLPPDSERDSFTRCGSRPHSSTSISMTCFAVSPVSPCSPAYRSRCSSTVRRSCVASNCGQYPIIARVASASATMSFPQMVASPRVGICSPQRIEIVVVLPAPLVPRNPNTSPLCTPNERFFTARTPPLDG
mmetsp:Transcript_16278/g.50523  ORF Transcript_16278/g.50523 Transcript_16278/m.50523 type:complete len:205 (+) Transcript_16278:418-1032(+)